MMDYKTFRVAPYMDPKDQRVTVQFEIPYLDWCELEKSQIWNQLSEVVRAAQTKLEPNTRTSREDLLGN